VHSFLTLPAPKLPTPLHEDPEKISIFPAAVILWLDLATQYSVSEESYRVGWGTLLRAVPTRRGLG